MDNIIYPNHRYRQKAGAGNLRRKQITVLDVDGRRKILNTILTGGIILMAVYLFFFFVFHLAIKPSLIVDNVEIRFQEKLDIDQKDIMAVTGLDRPVRFLDVEESRIEEAVLKSFPYVKDVSVRKILPTTVSIKIYGRKPVCVSLYNTKTVSVPFAVDTEGRIFELGTAVKEFDLPVISGFEIPTLELNAAIPVSYVPVLEDLEYLQEHQPSIYGRISEIAVDEKNGNGYDLYVYFRMYDLPIRMGSRLDATEIEAAVQVLDLLQSSGLTDAYRLLDFRSGKPILKKQ